MLNDEIKMNKLKKRTKKLNSHLPLKMVTLVMNSRLTHRKQTIENNKAKL
jgi:hypothetical protein